MANLHLNKRFLAVAVLFAICLLAVIAPAAAVNAWYEVHSNPSGAWACLDGWNCDYTTITFAVEPSSYHTITVYQDGYQMWSDYVGTGSASTTTIVNANLVQNSPSVGWLDINPFGADIYIDNEYYGNGAQTIPLSPGTHTLLLKKPGYYDFSEQITISADKTFSHNPGMTPYPQAPVYGDLRIQSDPAGAAVYVNNDYKGTTYPNDPLYVTQLAPGTYTVRLTMPDYQPYTETTVVKAGMTGDISATLVPAAPGPAPDTTGQILAYSTPAGANIYLDNAYRGITPLTLASIPAGSHTVTFRLNGYNDLAKPVVVAGGSTVDASGTLAKASSPQPTKSGLSVAIALAGAGICSAVFIQKKRE